METAMNTLAEIRPIRTDDDHRCALKVIEGLWGAEPDTDEYDRLDVLATLIEAYEGRRWPIIEMDPVEAISGAIESGEHTRAELAELIGQSRATEVLKRKRYLTLPMIRQIAGNWGLPVGMLVKEYDLATTAKAKALPRLYSTKGKAARSNVGKRTRSKAGETL
jgi:HTH-type transcriptional regulator/antitoxin HigA